MKSTATASRLGLVIVLLTLVSACNHMAVQESGVAGVSTGTDKAKQKSGAGIMRYPVRMREVRVD